MNDLIPDPNLLELGIRGSCTDVKCAASWKGVPRNWRSELLKDTPRGAGQLVLFLDFDGVLHHENVLWHPKKGAYLCAPSQYTLFQRAGLLVRHLEPYPTVRIVLSTSWVRSYSCANTAKRLPDALRKLVIGATFHSQIDEPLFDDTPRGVQVWQDVVRRNPKDWLALDDDHVDWPTWCLNNYIQTHEH